MGTLGPDRLSELLQGDRKLVENLSERDTLRPEGAGYDFRVGEIFKITSSAYLGTEEREIAKLELVAKYEPKNEEQIFVIEPKKAYIIKTVEKVNMPIDLTASISLRRTGYSGALILSGGNVAPEYSGELSVAIYNASDFDFRLALGSRLLFVKFEEVTGATGYKGQWQDNNMHRTGKETQI